MSVEYTGAQSLYNGISQAGNSLGSGLAQGIQNWKAGKAAAAAANATAKYIQANAPQMGMDPDQVQQFTQQGPHESPIAYNTRLNQAIQNMMVGQKVKESQAAIALQQQQAAGLQAGTAGQDITNQQQQIALQQQRAQAAYLQSMSGGVGSQAGQQPQGPSNIPAYLQPNQSQGQPAAAPQPPAPPQAQPMPQGQGPAIAPPQASPQAPAMPMAPTTANAGLSQGAQQYLSQQYGAYVRSVHAAPSPELVQNWVKQYASQEKPIGITQGGVVLDPQGNVVGTKWSRVTQSNAGTKKILPPDSLLPVGQTPQGVPILDGLGNPISPGAVGQASAQPGVVASTAPVSIPDTTERQQAIKDATEHLNLLTQNEQKIQSLGSQVAAYIQANPNMASNAMLGTPEGLKLRAMLGDATGQALNQGIAQNLNAIMDNMRDGKTGSLGMRLTQQEFQQMKEGYPSTTQASQVQISGWQNMAATNAYAKNYAAAYLKNLQTMKPGDAAAKANAEVQRPSITSLALPPAPPPFAQTKAQRDALKSGTVYQGPDGQLYRKK